MSVDEEAVGRLVRRLESLGIPYMVAGSMASSHHGLPRATNDADIVIDPTPEALEALVTALAAERYYVDVRASRNRPAPVPSAGRRPTRPACSP